MCLVSAPDVCVSFGFPVLVWALAFFAYCVLLYRISGFLGF